jgi:hypothetical protein
MSAFPVGDGGVWGSDNGYGSREATALAVEFAAGSAGRCQEEQYQSGLIRCIFTSPFRPAPVVDPAWLTWRGGFLRELACAAYEERRLPEGTLDPRRLEVLADGLEDAGCTDTEILGHLRGGGVHVRGCWVVDLLLTRE